MWRQPDRVASSAAHRAPGEGGATVAVTAVAVGVRWTGAPAAAARRVRRMSGQGRAVSGGGEVATKQGQKAQR